MPRRLAYLILIFVFVALCSCKKAKPVPKAAPTKAYKASELTIYCTDRFRSSGLEGTIIPDFSKKYNCKINLVMQGDTADLASSLSVADSTTVDLVIGLTNSFAWSDSLLDWFEPINLNSGITLSRDANFDSSKRLIPYGYSYLSLVYDTRQLSSPPTSFGSMQDATYISQMAICDPNRSGLGRATLLWLRALFGERGHEVAWSSLRKNIGIAFASQEEAFSALKDGRYAMILGYSTIPAMFLEQDSEAVYFKSQMLEEGSFRYIEGIGLHRNNRNPEMAQLFIEHLLSSGSQHMVMYKLGLFPANSKTSMPISFSRVPVYSFSVDNRLSEEQISTGLSTWLSFWNNLFNLRYLD